MGTNVTESVQESLEELPEELEKLVSEGDLNEVKRVSGALRKRIARRELKENPAAVAQAIIDLKNGNK